MTLKQFILNLQFIVRPKYWFFNNEFSKEWDITLNQLLDQYKFTNIGAHQAELGPATLWIANVPYATMHTDHKFMRPSDKRFYPKFYSVRPSRLTILRCLKRLKEDVKTPQEIRDDKLNRILKKKLL